jgi:hypothetical protein
MNSPLERHEVRLRGLHGMARGAAAGQMPARPGVLPSPTQFVGEGPGMGGAPAAGAIHVPAPDIPQPTDAVARRTL